MIKKTKPYKSDTSAKSTQYYESIKCVIGGVGIFVISIPLLQQFDIDLYNLVLDSLAKSGIIVASGIIVYITLETLCKVLKKI